MPQRPVTVKVSIYASVKYTRKLIKLASLCAFNFSNLLRTRSRNNGLGLIAVISCIRVENFILF